MKKPNPKKSFELMRRSMEALFGEEVFASAEKTATKIYKLVEHEKETLLALEIAKLMLGESIARQDAEIAKVDAQISSPKKRLKKSSSAA